MDRRDLSLPLTTSTEQFNPWTSPNNWIISPSTSGYESSSPLSTSSPDSSRAFFANPWNESTNKDEQANNRCSQADPEQQKSSTMEQPSSNSSLFSSRDYSSPAVDRAIVTVDAEQIAPDAPPHHPLDVVANEIFVRKPWGIATNTRTEQFYVADRQYHVILVFGPDGHYQGVIGEPGQEPGQFNRPTGLAYDAVNDRIIVSDKDNHRIQIFSAATGRLIFTFGSQGSAPGQFSFPWGVAVSPDGNHIAVTDSRNRRVQLFTCSGIYVRHLRINKSVLRRPNQPKSQKVYSYLRGIVFDKSGDFLYLSDFNLHRIYRLDMGLTKVDTIVDESGKLTRPSGIDLDQDGNLLVCDTRNNRIRVFHPSGQALGTLRLIGGTILDLPLDVSVMRAGYIAALDLNGRVRIF